MGVRIVGEESGAMACLYDSVTGHAFGPVFSGVQETDDFLEWYGTGSRDLRELEDSRLDELVSEFRKEREADVGSG